MGVKYRSTFKSNIGVTWQIDLHDTAFSGSATTFTVAGEGFTMERNATNSERTAAILGSEVTVHALAQNSAFDNALRQLVADGEDQHFAVIYKDSALWWAGMLLMDMYEEEDAPYPRRVDLRFTDGLARLKEIEYTGAGTRYTGTATMIEHIWNVLALVPSLQFWAASGQTTLRTSMHYFDSQMSYSNTTDPLPSIRVPHSAFWTEESNGEYTIANAYEVLEQLAANFYARFWLGDGAFNFVQVEELKANTVRVFNYDKNGTTATGRTDRELRIPLDQQKNGLVKLAGMVKTYFPALKTVRKKYKHDTSGNFLPSPLIINAAARDIGDVDTNGGDARLSVQGAIKLTIINALASTTTIPVVRVRFKIKQGTRYLKRDNTNAAGNTDYSAMTWTVVSSDTVQFFTGGLIKASTGATTITRSIQVDFTTPILLNDGAVEVELISLEASDVFDAQGNAITSGVTVTGEFDGYIEYVTPDDAENERDFKATNGLLASLSRILELPDAQFGDEINSSTKNAIEVWDGIAWVRSNVWKKKNSGTAKALYQLLCEEVMGGQTKNVERVIADLRGDFSFFNTMYVNPDVYIPLSGTFLANSAMWTRLELFKHDFETADVIVVGEPAPIDRNLIQPPSRSFSAGGLVIDETVRLNIASVNPTDTLDNLVVGPPVAGLTGTGNLLLGGGSNLTSGSNNVLIAANAFSPTINNELNIADMIVGNLNNGHIGLGGTDVSHMLTVQDDEQCVALFKSSIAGGGIGFMDASTTDDESVGIGALGDDLCFRSGGAAAGNMRLMADGNLGVGTVAPERRLHVYVDNQSNVGLFESGITQSRLLLKDASTTTAGSYVGSAGNVLRLVASTTLEFYASNVVAARFLTNRQLNLVAYGLNTFNDTPSTFAAFNSTNRLIEYTLQDFFALVPDYDTNAAAAVDLAVGETYYNNTDNTYKRVV